METDSEYDREIFDLDRWVFTERVLDNHRKEGQKLLRSAIDDKDQDAMFAFYALMRRTYALLKSDLESHLSNDLAYRLPIDPYSLFPGTKMFSWSRAEEEAWNIIRETGIALLPQWPVKNGFKAPKDHYYLDFANPWLGICIEIDGAQHLDGSQKWRDKTRNEIVSKAGFDVYRLPTPIIYNQDKRGHGFWRMLDVLEPDQALDAEQQEIFNGFYYETFEGFLSCLIVAHSPRFPEPPQIFLASDQNDYEGFIQSVVSRWKV